MKYYGKVGYVESRDNGNDIWEDVVTERFLYGDVVSDTRRTELNDRVIPDYHINAQFSLVADTYCYDHLEFLRYVTYRGVKWEVTSVVPMNFPRITVTVGKVYNGPEVDE